MGQQCGGVLLQVWFSGLVGVGQLSSLVAVPSCLGIDDNLDTLGHEHHSVGFQIAVVDFCRELELVVVVFA